MESAPLCDCSETDQDSDPPLRRLYTLSNVLPELAKVIGELP
jgi:hypothetical protein